MVYSSPSNRDYKQADGELATPVSNVSSCQSVAHKPAASLTSQDVEDGAIGRSVSTATLTSGELEAEPTYAVPLATVVKRPKGPQAPPPVPPKGPFSTFESDRFIAPPTLAVTPQPPSHSSEATPHRRAASALRVCYQRSPIFADSTSRRPASTVSSSGSTASWYADILPYKPSTLPETLADRLKQRNSFVLSSGTPSVAATDNLMTRSLFESRHLSTNNTVDSGSGVNSRPNGRMRPVSFHDASPTSINLPSLDHLLKVKGDQRPLPRPRCEATTTKSPIGFPLEPLHLQPSDSPLLGQYCRLKLIIPLTSNFTSPNSNAGPCTTFM
uniref:Uncharacterized protein n=1 Tax=Mesocestoides corti TaxID=53468 RepID=A0A5K3EY00_MESCO